MLTQTDAALGALFLADLIAERPAWAADGLCQEYPAVSWFPTRGDSGAAARAVCRRCMVQVECVAFALANPDLHGIWGATSLADRDKARTAGFDAVALIDSLQARVEAPEWHTDPCRGCGGLLSRKDLLVEDGLCWACRPVG
ncbi:MAG TPA: WhiB family transcriptional regulator [Acidimicrobiia bacterium]